VKETTVSVAEAAIAREAVLPVGVQEALGELVGVAKEGLLALGVGVGLGVMAELMEEEVVRHEALSDRAGCETSPAGCRSGSRKLRAAGSRARGGRWEAALTTTGRAGTVGRCGPGKRGREA
jgi:hypothetical protein